MLGLQCCCLTDNVEWLPSVKTFSTKMQTAGFLHKVTAHYALRYISCEGNNLFKLFLGVIVHNFFLFSK